LGPLIAEKKAFDSLDSLMAHATLPFVPGAGQTTRRKLLLLRSPKQKSAAERKHNS
jgi:hypothetical protein